jgi:hypothetical protein
LAVVVAMVAGFATLDKFFCWRVPENAPRWIAEIGKTLDVVLRSAKEAI